MIRSLTEAAFVYGEFKTYQLPIIAIEKMTNLDFAGLKEFDPLSKRSEAIFGEGLIAIDGAESLVL